MEFTLYILLCNDKSLYTGITTNLEKRVKQHNGVLKGGAKYTQSKRPVKVIYSEKYETRSQALKREIIIKKLSRQDKIDLFLKIK